ncbi:MAG: ornithine cyclodeaminase family protein, partial [Acidimicrobiia bacterium]|nr:ornithine cyclodeaminase family protein [Acidimicrobiia bacterium]
MQVSETAIVGRNALGRILRETGRDRFLDELITRMGAAISRFDSDELVTRNRDGFQYAKPDWGLVEWMPAMDTGRRVAIKTVGYHPSNP